MFADVLKIRVAYKVTSQIKCPLVVHNDPS